MKTFAVSVLFAATLYIWPESSVFVAANVIGIDFGTESMKVALVQPGAPLEIVTNHFSKRKTETAVAFVRGERYFGSDAFGHLSRKPDCAYARLSPLLGQNHPDAARSLLETTYMPMKIAYNETRGALGVSVDGQEVSVEELVAMVLAYAKDMTRAYGGNVVRDCVITVPQFAKQPEREAMMRAADLADLRVLSLIDENTAAAVQFGLDRIYEEKRLVLFYNLGSEFAQASLVEYSTFVEGSGSAKKSSSGSNKTVGQLEVRGKGWAAGAGSFALDLALTELLCDEFEKQHKGKYSLRTIARPMAKLRASAKKVKEVLSSNKEIPVNIPALHDDVDFSTTLTRAQLERAGEPVFDKLTKPIADAVEMADLSFDDIDAVEIIGGGVRVPKVQQVLKAYLSEKRSKDAPVLDLGLHLNGDEAVALGAAFHGANVSTSFRVRKVGLSDVSPFAVGVSLDSEEDALPASSSETSTKWHKSASLFKKGSKYGGKAKTIAFQHDADLTCELRYEDGDEGTIALYNISGIAEFARDMKTNATNKPKVMLSFVLDSSGLTTLSKAEVSLQVPIPNATTTTETDTTNASSSSTSSDGDADAATAESASPSETTPKDENETSKEEEEEEDAVNATTTTNASSSAAAVNTTKPKPTSKLHKRSLSASLLKSGTRSWASVVADAADAKQRLADLEKAEALRHALAAAKNDLESAIYATRNALEDRADELSVVSTEEQRDAVRASSTELEDWLYDVDDATATVSLFVDKRRALESSLEAIVERHDEYSKRDPAVAKARAALAVARKNATEVWPESKPWLEVDDLDELVSRVDKAEQWLDEVVAKQSGLELHETPAFYVADIAPKLKPVAQIAARLESKPKPKPPATNETAAAKKNDTSADANETAAESESSSDSEADAEASSSSSSSSSEKTPPPEDAAADKEAWDEL